METPEVSFKRVSMGHPEENITVEGVVEHWISGSGWVRSEFIGTPENQVKQAYEVGAERISLRVHNSFNDSSKLADYSLCELMPGLHKEAIEARIYEYADMVDGETTYVERNQRNELSMVVKANEGEGKSVTPISERDFVVYYQNSTLHVQDFENKFCLLIERDDRLGLETSTVVYMEDGLYKQHECHSRFRVSGSGEIVPGDKIRERSEEISIMKAVKLFNAATVQRRNERFASALDAKAPYGIKERDRVLRALYRETEAYKRNERYQSLEKLLPALFEERFKGARVETNGVRIDPLFAGVAAAKLEFDNPFTYSGLRLNANGGTPYERMQCEEAIAAVQEYIRDPELWERIRSEAQEQKFRGSVVNSSLSSLLEAYVHSLENKDRALGEWYHDNFVIAAETFGTKFYPVLDGWIVNRTFDEFAKRVAIKEKEGNVFPLSVGEFVKRVIGDLKEYVNLSVFISPEVKQKIELDYTPERKSWKKGVRL